MHALRAIFLGLFGLTALCYAAENSTMTSLQAPHDRELNVDVHDAFWRDAPAVSFRHDKDGNPVPGHDTEVRSRWTSKNLYLLFVCHYQELYLKPNPDPVNETNELWNWDVAEAFIGDDFKDIHHYKEFELSPQGEWVDLDIRQVPPKPDGSWHWNSGYKVKAKIDAANKVWYGAMEIPFASISAKPPASGLELRINLFRAQGPPADRKLMCWQPTHSKTFHVPEVFGTLRLTAQSSAK
jgi:hypothetical protein